MESYDFKNAFFYLNKTISYSPEYYKGYYNRGLLNGKIEKYDDAITYLEKYEPEENDDIAKKYAEIGYTNYKLKNNEGLFVTNGFPLACFESCT